ncbi:hypothetical protein MKX03_017945 [Papaver bracteatum]|nr:hypothetical protein MKX03_017945 [Papaver bracteatum]
MIFQSMYCELPTVADSLFLESSTSKESVGLCNGGLSWFKQMQMLFLIPTREDLNGPIETLPAPTTRLPRKKPCADHLQLGRPLLKQKVTFFLTL